MFNWFTRRKAPQSGISQPSSQAPTLVVTDEQGRRHREDVPYALPKDLEEGQRLNLQDYLLRYMLHGNYLSNLKTISRK